MASVISVCNQYWQTIETYLNYIYIVTLVACLIQIFHYFRRYLDQELVKTQEEIERKTLAIESYQSVGMGFDKLVTEYSHLLEEIERRQWGLKELNKHRGTRASHT